MDMSQIYEVSYIGTPHTVLVDQASLRLYENEQGVVDVKKIEKCQSCGNPKGDMQVLGGLVRCSPCSNQYEDIQERAYSYQNDIHSENYYSHDCDAY